MQQLSVISLQKIRQLDFSSPHVVFQKSVTVLVNVENVEIEMSHAL